MHSEQKEHTYADFAAGSTYLKVKIPSEVIYLFIKYVTLRSSQYRKVVLEWMIDVCEYFNLHPTTTHAAAAYLDRLQPNEKFSRFEWQMLAICCILISGDIQK